MELKTFLMYVHYQRIRAHNSFPAFAVTCEYGKWAEAMTTGDVYKRYFHMNGGPGLDLELSQVHRAGIIQGIDARAGAWLLPGAQRLCLCLAFSARAWA